MIRRAGNAIVARVAACTATVIWLFVFAGLFFHHSREPMLLHRFSGFYALGLLAFLAATPVVFFQVRGLFSPSVVRGPDGASRVVSPVSKIGLLVIPTLLVYGLLQLVLPKRQGWEYLPHPFLQAVPAPNAAKGINTRGFRGSEPATPKPKALFRVVLLGGSTTFDPELPYEDTYGRQLELALGRALSPRKAEVQCAAVSAYDSEHSLIRYAADAIDLDADVVLVMHAVNDLHVNTFRPFRRDYGSYPGVGEQHLHQGFRDRTHLADTIGFFARYVLFSDFRRPDDFRADAVVPDPEPFVRNLREIVVLGRSRGQRVVLCTQPHRFRLDGPEADKVLGEAALRNFFNGAPLPGFVWFSRYMIVFNDRVRALAAEEGLPVFDLQRDVPPTRELFIDEMHVNPRGARLEASLAAKFLVENGFTR